MTRCPTLALSKILALHFGHILIKRNMRLTSLLGKRATVSEVDTNQGGFCLQNSSHRGIQLTEAEREPQISLFVSIWNLPLFILSLSVSSR